MIRSWGVVTLGATSAPWFGDVTTAAFVPPTGNNLGSLAVASTTRYRVGDRIILGADQAKPQIVMVDGITDATHLAVKAEGGATLSAWISGTIICLSIRCFKVVIQAVDGNTGAVWIGSDKTVTNVGGGSGFFKLQIAAAAAQLSPPFDYADANGANALGTAEGWYAGTNGDKVAVAAYIN
jgi:hypothetical protein